MPIQRRKESRSGFYHIVVKGINNERIYNQEREKDYFISIILKHLEKCEVQIFAFCIMSNHAHFIIRAEIQELSKYMARILAEYASYYNYKHHRNGHVFQNRFSSECVETEKYYWNCLRYIHLNPVKASMVQKALNYKYSSMQEYYIEKEKVLHPKALDMYRTHFSDYEHFESFHDRCQHNIFIDIRNEVFMQQLEFAEFIAGDLQREKNKKLLLQVFEEKKIREEYILRLQQDLSISQKKSKDIYAMIKYKVENQ